MDIQAAYNNDTGVIEWQIANGDLPIAYSDLVSSIMVCLFSDARCDPSFTPPDGDPRGHWSSTYSTYPVGSTLWELDRAYFSGRANILLQARDATKTALQSFLDLGIASKITVGVAQRGQNGIAIQIKISRPTSGGQYDWLWRQLIVNPTASNQTPTTIIINSVLGSGFYLGYSTLG